MVRDGINRHPKKNVYQIGGFRKKFNVTFEKQKIFRVCIRSSMNNFKEDIQNVQ
jgi:hypothetical protein